MSKVSKLWYISDSGGQHCKFSRDQQVHLVSISPISINGLCSLHGTQSQLFEITKAKKTAN